MTDNSMRHDKTAFGLFLAFLILLIGSTAVSVVLRTQLILTNIDPKTGFYISSSPLTTVLNILLLATALALLSSLFMKKARRHPAARREPAFIGVVAILLAVALFLDGGSDVVSMVVSTGGAGNFFTGIVAVMASVFFLLFAFGNAKGNAPHPAAALLPVLWAVLHLMVSFMHYTTIVNISEYLYDMLKMVFVMIFFYYYARYAGGVPNGRETAGMLAFGLPTVLFSLVSTLPRYIAYFAGNTKVTLSVFDDSVFLMLSIFILAVLFSTFSRAEKGEPPAFAASAERAD